MAESKVKRENYIMLQGWMLTDLGLKGNELILYACIYGFSQAEDQVFTGSLQYLADWTNSTKQGVMKCLKSLVEKGYIIKAEKLINGVKFCEYHATLFNGGMQQSCMGYATKLHGGMQQSLPNNLVDTLEDTLEEKKERKEGRKSHVTYDAIISEYTEDTSLRETLGEFLKMRQRIRKPMTDYALSLMLKKLDKMASTVTAKVDILNQSIMNGWQDVYELKGGKYNAEHVRNNKRADTEYESGIGWDKIL